MDDAKKLEHMLKTNPQFSCWFDEYLKSSAFKKTYPQDVKDFFGRSYLTTFSSFDKIYAKFEDEMSKATQAIDLHKVWIRHRMATAGDTEKTELSNSTKLIDDFNTIFKVN